MVRPLRASVLRRAGLLLPRRGWMLDAAAAAAAVLSCYCGGGCTPRESRAKREREREWEGCRELPRNFFFTGLPDAAIRWRLWRGCPHARTARHVSVFSKFRYAWMLERTDQTWNIQGRFVELVSFFLQSHCREMSLGTDRPPGFMQTKLLTLAMQFETFKNVILFIIIIIFSQTPQKRSIDKLLMITVAYIW